MAQTLDTGLKMSVMRFYAIVTICCQSRKNLLSDEQLHCEVCHTAYDQYERLIFRVRGHPSSYKGIVSSHSIKGVYCSIMLFNDALIIP
jgi:hypothetical protein